MHINTVAFIKIPFCLAYVVCESHGTSLRFCSQTEVSIRLLLYKENISVFICIARMIILSSLIESSYTWDTLTSMTLPCLSIISCLILEHYIFFLQCTLLISTAANGNCALLKSDYSKCTCTVVIRS